MTIYATWMISDNFGDKLTPWIINRLTGEYPHYLPFDARVPKYMVSGSILNHAVEYTTVWGAGFANEDDPYDVYADLRAVRGPMTCRKIRFEKGLDIHPAFGDPAWLLSDMLNDTVGITHDVGIIPHYMHQRDVNEWARGIDGVKIINLFEPIEKVVKDVLSCRCIYSSSLHGLIIADAFGIPSRWIDCTAKIGGDDFKFRDHIILKNCLSFTPEPKIKPNEPNPAEPAEPEYEPVPGIEYNFRLIDMFANIEAPNSEQEQADYNSLNTAVKHHLYSLPRNAQEMYDNIKDSPVRRNDCYHELKKRLMDACPFAEKKDG